MEPPCWATIFYPREQKLLVRNRRTRWTSQIDKFETLETRLAAPLAEIFAGVIEGVAKFDEHIERHQQTKCIFPTRIVDLVFNRNERAAIGKRSVNFPDEYLLFSPDSSHAGYFDV